MMNFAMLHAELHTPNITGDATLAVHCVRDEQTPDAGSCQFLITARTDTFAPQGWLICIPLQTGAEVGWLTRTLVHGMHDSGSDTDYDGCMLTDTSI